MKSRLKGQKEDFSCETIFVMSKTSSSIQEITEPESIPLDCFAHLDWDVQQEVGRLKTEGVELSTFTARVHARRQIVKEITIVPPPHKRLAQLLRVHAGDDRTDPAVQHSSCQVGSLLRRAPEREE